MFRVNELMLTLVEQIRTCNVIIMDNEISFSDNLFQEYENKT
jgi:hypothetical protein